MVLRLNGLKKFYKTKNKEEIRALDGVSLEADKGELVGVNGPSGCGKTTLLLVAGGLLYPGGGEVLLDDKDLYSISSDNRDRERAENMGFVFQQFYLIPYLDILENVLVPSAASGSHPSSPEKRAKTLIDRFGLSNRIRHKPGELSTGERQRVALARALINEPKVLFADEPTGNLDDENAKAVLEYISGFAEDGGTVLLVTHDSRITNYAHRRYNMKDGRFY
ncbi:MAG: ABC transporter ATP-binding protein [Bacteroidales bacterium]|nr:ABC transporter ATP-binding protein [Bacteroidales bacterium]